MSICILVNCTFVDIHLPVYKEKDEFKSYKKKCYFFRIIVYYKVFIYLFFTSDAYFIYSLIQLFAITQT